MSSQPHENDGDWDNVADGVEHVEKRVTVSTPGQKLDGMSALVYAAFWQQKIDGRFRQAVKDVSTTILFDMIDFRPAVLMTIDNGDYTVEPVEDPATLEHAPAAFVRGRMADAVQLLGGIGPVLKALFTGKFKIRGFRKLYLLLKVLGTKEVA
nr:hypothetical protein [Candidatus Sigynarchaeota archaeon]